MLDGGTLACRSTRIALADITGVHLAYDTDLFEPQIRARIVVRTVSSGAVELFPIPVVVYARGQLQNHPGHLRWLAHQVARVAGRATGREVQVSPERSPVPVPEPRWTDLPASLTPALPRNVREDANTLVWVEQAMQGRFAAMGIAALVLVGLPGAVIAFVGSAVLGALLGIDPGALVTLGWAFTAVAAIIAVLPFGWLALRARTHRADADGIALDSSPTVRIPWSEADGLVLSGRAGSAVALRTRSGVLLDTWHSTRWSSAPRIVDIIAFAERLAALGGVPLDLEIPEVLAWRDAEQERRDKEARRTYWHEIAAPIVFHRHERAEPVEPPGVKRLPQGWSLPVSSATWVQFGSQPVSWSRAMTTWIHADATGVGTGKHRRPWSEVEDFQIVWRTYRRGKRKHRYQEGRLELRTRGRRVQLGPWVPLQVDDQKLVPPGELVWIRDTLRALLAGYSGRDADRGTSEDVPDALKAIAARERQPERN